MTCSHDLLLNWPHCAFGFFPACWPGSPPPTPLWQRFFSLQLSNPQGHGLLTAPAPPCAVPEPTTATGAEVQGRGWAHDAETQWWFLSCSGQRRELFLGAGAEVFSNHFSMRIGSCLPGWDVMSARVSENSGDSGRKSLANEIGLGRA